MDLPSERALAVAGIVTFLAGVALFWNGQYVVGALVFGVPLGGAVGYVAVADGEPDLPETTGEWTLSLAGTAGLFFGSLLYLVGYWTSLSVGGVGVDVVGGALFVVGFALTAVDLVVVDRRYLAGVGYVLAGSSLVATLSSVADDAALAGVLVGVALYVVDGPLGTAARKRIGS